MYDAVAFLKWVSQFLYELTTEVSPEEKISGYEQLLVDAFQMGMSSRDWELAAMIPDRSVPTDPKLTMRRQEALKTITSPFLKEWLLRNPALS